MAITLDNREPSPLKKFAFAKLPKLAFSAVRLPLNSAILALILPTMLASPVTVNVAGLSKSAMLPAVILCPVISP
jgi:hypothetical protein